VVASPPFSSVSAFPSSFCFCFSVSSSVSDGDCVVVDGGCWWLGRMTVVLLLTAKRERPEREVSYCSSPLFFCFSVLCFYSLVSSSLPLSIRLPYFQNNLCSSLKQSLASFSLFGSLLQVRFPKFLPPLVSFFPFSFPPGIFPLLCIYSQVERESPLPCSIKVQEGNGATLPL
jgi:hypothetical protein